MLTANRISNTRGRIGKNIVRTITRNSSTTTIGNLSTDTFYDAIIIGVGGVGSFTLRSLARKSKSIRVLGIERFQLGHELGSSHGDSRLFRHAYFEHPSYVPLCHKSTQIFQELCDWKRTKSDGAYKYIPVLDKCGVLMVSDRITEDGTYAFIQKCLDSAESFDIPYEILDSSELRKRYGTLFEIKDDMKGLLEPGAGFVRPELALKYSIEDAVNHGADIITNTEVTSIKSSCDSSNTIHVETRSGETFQTRAVLVSAGAWASKLLTDWSSYLTVTRQVQVWFEPENVKKYRPLYSCPGWYLDRMDQTLGLYGFPADPLSTHHSNHVKVALHGRDAPFDPDDPRPEVTPEELDEIRDAIKDWIPEASDRIVSSKACLYTMSPDGHFIFDRAPGFGDGENVWCVAGLSGHGFKMAPSLGEAAADLILYGRTDLPIEFLKTDRLTNDLS